MPMIVKAAVYEGKKLPYWLIDIARIERQVHRPSSSWLDKKQIDVKLFRVLSIFFLTAIIIVFVYIPLVYWRESMTDLTEILANIIFISFIIITWLLPAYLLKRYFKKLETK